jgi:hypothetical protein
MTTRKKGPQETRAKKKGPDPKDGQAIAERLARRGVPEEDLQGPPARETTVIRDDRERAAEAHRDAYHDTSPRLTGGDPDADWERRTTSARRRSGAPWPRPTRTSSTSSAARWACRARPTRRSALSLGTRNRR